jgi:hypothetical protein
MIPSQEHSQTPGTPNPCVREGPKPKNTSEARGLPYKASSWAGVTDDWDFLIIGTFGAYFLYWWCLLFVLIRQGLGAYFLY